MASYVLDDVEVMHAVDTNPSYRLLFQECVKLVNICYFFLSYAGLIVVN